MKAKAYTDLEQSKKLAEILPLKSADMSYRASYRDNGVISGYQATLCPFTLASWIAVPCWSLAALLEELPDEITTGDGTDYNFGFYKDGMQYYVSYRDFNFEQEGIETGCYDDFVDAFYEMILNLHEQKLI